MRRKWQLVSTANPQPSSSARRCPAASRTGQRRTQNERHQRGTGRAFRYAGLPGQARADWWIAAELARRDLGGCHCGASSRNGRRSDRASLYGLIVARPGCEQPAVVRDEVLVLVMAGTAALAYSIPIGVAIAILIAVVVIGLLLVFRQFGRR